MFTSSRGPQDYKVVEYIALRYRDLEEGRDDAHPIASVKLFQILGSIIEKPFVPDLSVSH